MQTLRQEFDDKLREERKRHATDLAIERGRSAALLDRIMAIVGIPQIYGTIPQQTEDENVPEENARISPGMKSILAYQQLEDKLWSEQMESLRQAATQSTENLTADITTE